MTPEQIERLTTSMSKSLFKLSLRPGDIIIARDLETMGALCSFPLPGIPQCPIIYAPSGLDKCDLQTLCNALEQAQNLETVRLTALALEDSLDAPRPIN
jgi:hypothetical protein